MSIFKNSMAVRRFGVGDGADISTADDFVEQLEVGRFREIEVGGQVSSGFVPPANPFSNKDCDVMAYHIEGGWYVGAFRIDSKNIPTATLRRVAKAEARAAADKEGATFVSKARIKETTERVKLRMLENTVAREKVVPFYFNVDTYEGYFLDSSKALFEKFLDLFIRAVGVDLYERPATDELEPGAFLTWLWWDTESNSAMTHSRDNKLVMASFGDKVWVGRNDSSVSVNGDVEEARLAVSKGGLVTKAELFMGEGDQRTCVFDCQGFFPKVKFSKEELLGTNFSDDDGNMFLVLGAIQDLFADMEYWIERYRMTKDEGRGLTDEIRRVWGRGDFCSRGFEDI